MHDDDDLRPAAGMLFAAIAGTLTGIVICLLVFAMTS
jgi:hypothetical protein